jgi:hypothetical protein
VAVSGDGADSADCTVVRKCSSTGVTCAATDLACQSQATGRHLEILCVDSRQTPERYTYCPPDTGRADSGVIWVLMGVATLIAVAGGAIAWAVLRKKA